MMFNLHFHKYEILDMIEDSIYKKCKVCGKVIVEYDNLIGMDILTFNSSEQECINHRKLYDGIKSDNIRLKLIDTLKLQSKSKYTKRRT